MKIRGSKLVLTLQHLIEFIGSSGCMARRYASITTTMKFLGLFLLGLTIAFDSCGQVTSNQKAVSQSVTSFYTWYISTTKNKRYSEYVKAVRGDNGNTKLETREYFKILDSLGIIGQEFIDTEKRRFQPCEDVLKAIPWAEFSKMDDFPFEDQCGFLYRYYWTSGQEPHDGVDVQKITIDRNKALAETSIYFAKNEPNADKVLVWLSRINHKWMITKIDRLK